MNPLNCHICQHKFDFTKTSLCTNCNNDLDSFLKHNFTTQYHSLIFLNKDPYDSIISYPNIYMMVLKTDSYYNRKTIFKSHSNVNSLINSLHFENKEICRLQLDNISSTLTIFKNFISKMNRMKAFI